MSRILVIGGNGFVGREICRLAVESGHEVQSLSRSGRPAISEPWVKEIDWIAANLFEPHQWRDQLVGCDAVIHTVGIIRETPSKGVTFERINGDSPLIAALEAERADVPTFVFLSVMDTPPFTSETFRIAKRRAEQSIADLDIRTSVLRLGPVYGEGTNQGHFPRTINAVLRAIDEREWLARRFGDGRPLGVTTVAQAALHAAFNSTAPETMEIDEISTYSVPPL